MDQQQVNELLAASLDDAHERLQKQEDIIGLLVERIEALSYQVEGALNEAMVARQHYATARSKLGLSFDVTRGSMMGADFGEPS